MKELNFLPSERVLVLAPHPDDESIGCGGLLLKYKNQCDVAVLTDGSYGGLLHQTRDEIIKIRQIELMQAMNYVGIKNLISLDVEDGKLKNNFELFTTLKLADYDAIICPHPNDNHPDHTCVYDFLLQIKKEIRIFAYEVWSTLQSPSHYIDISDVVEEKKRLISFYTSQLSQVDYVFKTIGLNCFRGLLPYPAVPYAEAYQEMVD